jgi:hypothetical protein
MEEENEDGKIRETWLYLKDQFKDSQPSIEEPQQEEESTQESIPFERKRMDLNVYSFDETPCETIVETMKEKPQETPNEEIVEEIIQETMDFQEEVVPEFRVPFERKRLDLSIFTFDEPPMEHMEDKIQEEEYLSIPSGCACIWVRDEAHEEEAPRTRFLKTNHQRDRLKLKKTKNKLERLQAKITKRLCSSRSPLKRKHWNSGKRSRGFKEKSKKRV